MLTLGFRKRQVGQQLVADSSLQCHFRLHSSAAHMDSSSRANRRLATLNAHLSPPEASSSLSPEVRLTRKFSSFPPQSTQLTVSDLILPNSSRSRVEYESHHCLVAFAPHKIAVEFCWKAGHRFGFWRCPIVNSLILFRPIWRIFVI